MIQHGLDRIVRSLQRLMHPCVLAGLLGPSIGGGLCAQIGVGREVRYLLTHTCFISRPDTFALTRVIGPDGDLTYRRTFLDPSMFGPGPGMSAADLNGRIHYIFELQPGVDTLYSLYADAPRYPVSDGSQGFEGAWAEELVVDAAHTSILRDFGIHELDTSFVYHLKAFEKGRRYESNGYVLYVIEQWKSDAITTSCRVGSYSSSGQLGIQSNGPVDPGCRKKRLLQKALRKMDLSEARNCLDPSQGWDIDLIYILGHRYLISWTCASNTRGYFGSMQMASAIPAFAGACCRP